MEMIQVFNNNTLEVLEKTFATPEEADDYETVLEFLGACYKRFHNGEGI